MCIHPTVITILVITFIPTKVQQPATICYRNMQQPAQDAMERRRNYAPPFSQAVA